MIGTEQIAVTTDPALIDPAAATPPVNLPSGGSLTIQVRSGGPVFIGALGVSASHGYELDAGDKVSIPFEGDQQRDFHIVGGAAAAVHVLWSGA